MNTIPPPSPPLCALGVFARGLHSSSRAFQNIAHMVVSPLSINRLCPVSLTLKCSKKLDFQTPLFYTCRKTPFPTSHPLHPIVRHPLPTASVKTTQISLVSGNQRSAFLPIEQKRAPNALSPIFSARPRSKTSKNTAPKCPRVPGHNMAAFPWRQFPSRPGQAHPIRRYRQSLAWRASAPPLTLAGGKASLSPLGPLRKTPAHA